MHNAFAAAGEALTLLCRLRGIEASDLPASEVDDFLNMALEEAARSDAGRSETRRN
jgi:hypothetical protein